MCLPFLSPLLESFYLHVLDLKLAISIAFFFFNLEKCQWNHTFSHTSQQRQKLQLTGTGDELLYAKYLKSVVCLKTATTKIENNLPFPCITSVLDIKQDSVRFRVLQIVF